MERLNSTRPFGNLRAAVLVAGRSGLRSNNGKLSAVSSQDHGFWVVTARVGMSDYDRIKARIEDLYREVATGEDDHAEVTLHGTQIRVWRTRINCSVRTHLGYKRSWQTWYTKTDKNRLTELLLQRKGAL